MTDSWGDGWNNNVIGLRQTGVIVASFGADFTTGHNYGPVTVTVPVGTPTEIVVHTLGSWRSEVGFTIYDADGNQIFHRSSGQTFSATTVFGTFTLGTLNYMNVRVADILSSDSEKKI